MLTYSLKIKKKIKETKDSVSFIFEVPKEHQAIFLYTPAQFLTFEFQREGKKLLRSYSLSSSPLLNEELKTTVKRVEGGIISNYMVDSLKEGDILSSRKPAGRFFKPPKDLKPKHYFLFAGGSGITPLFSIIKTVLLSDSQNKVSLFYANRDETSIIYHTELKHWVKKYKQQFNIIHILSQPQKKEHNISGRLKKEYLQKYFSDISINHPDHLYYLCGPLGFMDTIESFLNEQKVHKKNINKEIFLSAPQKKQISKETTSSSNTINTENKDQSTCQITVSPETGPQPEVLLTGKEGEGDKASPKIIKAFINEEKITISAQPDIPILEQLLSAGYSPPFSCLSGSCMSCLATLKKGRIIQEEKGILEEENLQNHEILTCQAKPESYLVEVDYDNL